MATKKQEYHPKGSLEFLISYTKLQKAVINFFRSNNISILTGDPGTSKTFCSIYYALMMLRDDAIEKIVISKPLIEVGSSIGFLPGSEEEKTSVYLDSYINIFKKIIGEGAYRSLVNGKKIVFQPVNFVRGDTFENCLVIMDEAQGLTLHELITFSTRLHENSQMLILGDEFQADIKRSGLSPFKQITRGIDRIGQMELGDEYQMRNPMIVSLYKNYKSYLNERNS